MKKVVLSALLAAFLAGCGGASYKSLDAAVAKGKLAEIEKLSRALDLNAAYGKHQLTPLMTSVVRKKTNSLNKLLALGADPNAANEFGETALLYAVAYKNAAMVKALLNAGADKDAVASGGKFAGKSIYDVAVSRNNSQIVQMLAPAAAQQSQVAVQPQAPQATARQHKKASSGDDWR